MAQGPAVGGTGERTPEEIRRDIETTRADMSGTLDDLEYKVSPSGIRERQTQRIKGRWNSLREAVMGADDDDYSSSSYGYDTGPSRAQQARETMTEAPQRARARTRGNPLGAGLIAFGGGLLAAALLPSTRQEQHVAQELRDRYEEPVKSGMQEAGQRAKEELQPRLQQAADDIKETAAEGAQQTREDARSSAQQVKDDAQRVRES